MLKLTDLEKCQLLLGNFYGDGNYQRHKKYKNATYILSKHSNKQKDYVLFLEELYMELEIYQFATYDKMTSGGFIDGNLYSYVAAKPPIIDFFESNDFIQNGKKVITENGLMQLSELGLLLWYLDDGSLCYYKNSKGTKRHSRLSTQCYTLDEHSIIQKIFKQKWNFDVKIYGQHHQYTGKYYNYICFEATQFRKMFDLLRKYLHIIPESMKYKFNMNYTVPRLTKYNLL